jgi:membrane fusion protein, multidrug efflux system
MIAIFLQSLRFPFAAILAFALVRCGDNKAAAVRQTDDAIPVKLLPVERRSYSPVLQYSGTIASNSEARLSFKIGGIISKIFVKEGDRVAAGQLLASLDLTEIDAQVQQASQNADKALRDEGRIKNLYNDTVASLEQLQNIHTQLTVANEGLRIARFNRQYAQIRATSGGAILQKFLNEGEYASAGTAVLLFNGAAAGDWVVRLGVADRDWAILKKGDKATVTIDAYSDKSFTGVITKMAETADLASGTYPIEIKVLPGGYRFAPGLFCSVQLQPSVKQTLTMIPVETLAEGDGKTGYVYTLNADNRTVKKNLIHIAFLEKDKIAVSSGLDKVDRLIGGGVGYLTDSSIVKPVN